MKQQGGVLQEDTNSARCTVPSFCTVVVFTICFGSCARILHPSRHSSQLGPCSTWTWCNISLEALYMPITSPSLQFAHGLERGQ